MQASCVCNGVRPQRVRTPSSIFDAPGTGDVPRAALPDDDIFETRGISRDGAVVIVRPDQYVAHILPLEGAETRASLEAFLGTWMLPQA